MPFPSRAGILIYAKNLEAVASFYAGILGAVVVHADSEHKVLQSADAQLIIHAIPQHIADGIVINSPPEPREEQAIKPFFTVTDLDAAEQLVAELGGKVHGKILPAPGLKVRNVCDPEGNIVHLRASAA
jgi:predicted enzyme related to lactoylglutathione lyase